MHAIEEAETKLQHELAPVLRAGATECFECCIGLACRENTAHDASDMEMHRSVWRPWKQLTQQLREGKMPAGVDPILRPFTGREHNENSHPLIESEYCVVSAIGEMSERQCCVTRGAPEWFDLPTRTVR